MSSKVKHKASRRNGRVVQLSAHSQSLACLFRQSTSTTGVKSSVAKSSSTGQSSLARLKAPASKVGKPAAAPAATASKSSASRGIKRPAPSEPVTSSSDDDDDPMQENVAYQVKDVQGKRIKNGQVQYQVFQCKSAELGWLCTLHLTWWVFFASSFSRSRGVDSTSPRGSPYATWSSVACWWRDSTKR
jgi:hypothetical protein